jgi:hypothetical protein
MALKPDTSLAVALATGTVVYAIFQNATPSIADIRSLESGNEDIQRAERAASWTAAAVVAGISLLAKDATVFIIGGSLTVAMAWAHRHADTVDTVTKRASSIVPTKLSEVGNTGADLAKTPAQDRVPLNIYSTSVI